MTDDVCDRASRAASLIRQNQPGPRAYIGMDVSGGMSVRVSALYKSIVLTLLRDEGYARVTVFAFDARVIARYDLYTPRAAMRMPKVFGSGTDPCCVIDAMVGEPDSGATNLCLISDGMFNHTEVAEYARRNNVGLMLVTPKEYPVCGNRHIRVPIDPILHV